MECPHCQSQRVVENGKYRLKDGQDGLHHLCRDCGKRFSARTGTPLFRLRASPEVVATALKMRGEGLGVGVCC